MALGDTFSFLNVILESGSIYIQIHIQYCILYMFFQQILYSNRENTTILYLLLNLFLQKNKNTASFHVLSDNPILISFLHHGQSLTEISSNGFKMPNIEMQSGQYALIASTKAALHRITSRDTQLPPYSDPGGGFLIPFDLEGAERQRESWRSPLHEMR